MNGHGEIFSNVSEDGTSTMETPRFHTGPANASALAVPEGCRMVQRTEFVPWDNPENLISHEVQQAMDDFLKVVALPICFVICAPTNVLNMAVFYKQGLKERINLCLFFLAFSDLAVVSLYFASGSGAWLAKLTNDPSMKMKVARVFLNNYLLTLSGFIYVSSFLSTVIACERCLCVVSPLRSQTLLKTKTMGAIIFVGHAVIMGSFYIAGATFNVVCVFDPVTNTTSDMISASEFYINNIELVKAFEGYFAGFALPGLCLTGVSIATVVTVVKLRQMSKWRRESTSSGGVAMSTRDEALTRMLVGVGVVFIICTFPGVGCHTAALLIPGMSIGGKYNNTYFLMISVQLLFVYINSSVNFFIYYKNGSRFRRTLRSLFCSGGRIKMKSNANSVNENTLTLQEIPTENG